MGTGKYKDKVLITEGEVDCLRLTELGYSAITFNKDDTEHAYGLTVKQLKKKNTIPKAQLYHRSFEAWILQNRFNDVFGFREGDTPEHFEVTITSKLSKRSTDNRITIQVFYISPIRGKSRRFTAKLTHDDYINIHTDEFVSLSRPMIEKHINHKPID